VAIGSYPISNTGNDQGNWVVVGGTGAYADLHGTGKVTGTALGPNSIDDEYAGSMHID
jgi:hypothetical protein